MRTPAKDLDTEQLVLESLWWVMVVSGELVGSGGTRFMELKEEVHHRMTWGMKDEKVERLKREVEEWKRSVEAVALASKEVEDELRSALKNAKECLWDLYKFLPVSQDRIKEALQAIKECGVE